MLFFGNIFFKITNATKDYRVPIINVIYKLNQDYQSSDDETYDKSFLEDTTRSDRCHFNVKDISSLNMEITREEVKNAIFRSKLNIAVCADEILSATK